MWDGVVRRLYATACWKEQALAVVTINISAYTKSHFQSMELASSSAQTTLENQLAIWAWEFPCLTRSHKAYFYSLHSIGKRKAQHLQEMDTCSEWPKPGCWCSLPWFWPICMSRGVEMTDSEASLTGLWIRLSYLFTVCSWASYLIYKMRAMIVPTS